MFVKEEKCIILDFLPTGYPDKRYSEPIAQAIGTSYFSLLELVPQQGVTFKQEEEVDLSQREKIKFIRSSLRFRDLTNLARNILPDVIERIIRENEKRFIDFFNKSRIITPRMHQLQLLPGIGKKHLSDILNERNKKPFESFKDLEERVKLFPNPVKLIAQRVLEELENKEKYYLFVLKKQRRF